MKYIQKAPFLFWTLADGSFNLLLKTLKVKLKFFFLPVFTKLKLKANK
jgi:hypothetical protein